MKKKSLFTLLFLFLFCGVLFFYSEKADAIAVTVKRVIFEGSKRAEVITIINNSDSEQTYRIGWKQFRMTERRSLVPIGEDEVADDIKPASDMVIFSPRRFTLPARGAQQVRMILRAPSDLPDGEYRSHLWIHPEEDAEQFRDKILKTEPNPQGVFMQMLAGVSMPIIVRKGKLDLKVGIQGLKAIDEGKTLYVEWDFLREGGKSSYGNIDFICNKGEEQYLLKLTKGYSIYTETNKRNVRIRIAKDKEKPSCSTMTVRYTETEGFSGKPSKLLAEDTAKIQQK